MYKLFLTIMLVSLPASAQLPPDQPVVPFESVKPLQEAEHMNLSVEQQGEFEEEDEQKMRLCCECICVPHYPDPFCFLGDCIWVSVGEECPEPYMEPSDCPVGEDTPNVPPYLEAGDILFCECQDPSLHHIPGWDHVAIYVGENEFIEAVPGEGVRRIPLSDFYTWAEDITYGYVSTASPSQKESAADFADSQLNKPYQHIPTGKDPSPDSDAWYCSELVWAAYYQAGIDIDQNGWDYPHVVEPFEISLDDDVEPFTNEGPNAPTRPSGRDNVYCFETRPYTTSAVDPDGNDVFFLWSWGESVGNWNLLPRGSGNTVVEPHTWLTLGDHDVKVKAMDIWGYESSWSETLTVTVGRWLGVSPVHFEVRNELRSPQTDSKATPLDGTTAAGSTRPKCPAGIRAVSP